MSRFIPRMAVLAAALVLLGACQTAPPKPIAAPAVKSIDINSVRLSYIEQGKGAPVVLVHGAFSDARADLSDVNGPVQTQRIGTTLREALQP